jgi:hypothetical protein
MKQQASRKLVSRKRASKKKYPKILAIPSTADELQAVYKFTPEEIAYAKRILDKVERRRAKASK